MSRQLLPPNESLDVAPRLVGATRGNREDTERPGDPAGCHSSALLGSHLSPENLGRWTEILSVCEEHFKLKRILLTLTRMLPSRS